ncbi:hypothetical protein GW832_06605 [bacterium]|nr:hypothetical protein [bacterium]
MSKLSPDPITQSDIKKYLNNYSDFSFELQVLKKFTDLGFECSHGGTYEDPVTNKSREYDIRALLKKKFIRVHLSIECKNLRENFPLVVHCLERKENESYNELIFTFKPETPTQQIGPVSMPLPSVFIEFSRSIKVQQFSLYEKKQFVAKSADQVGKRNDNGEITSTDGEVFDKISQAINSSIDLITEAHYLDTDISPAYLTLVCPVLVIPDSSLWQAKYSDTGEQIEEPEQINHVSYYIGKEWTVGDKIHSLNYTLSHLEIVTFSEIQNFVEKYLGDYVKLCSAVINRGGDFA